MEISTYNKFIVALVGELIAFATLVITSEPEGITSSEWLAGGIGLAAALGVYQVRNTPLTR